MRHVTHTQRDWYGTHLRSLRIPHALPSRLRLVCELLAVVVLFGQLALALLRFGPTSAEGLCREVHAAWELGVPEVALRVILPCRQRVDRGEGYFFADAE